MWHLVFVILCGRLSGMQGGLALFPLSGMQEPTQIQANETRQARILVSPNSFAEWKCAQLFSRRLSNPNIILHVS